MPSIDDPDQPKQSESFTGVSGLNLLKLDYRLGPNVSYCTSKAGLILLDARLCCYSSITYAALPFTGRRYAVATLHVRP